MKPVCSSCVKSNVSHLCHYEEPSWISSEDLLRHAKPVNSNVKTPAESVDSPASVDLPPAVQTKIENLKDRIKQLEASIAVTELSRSTPPVFNSIYTQNPIQLPQPSFNGIQQQQTRQQPSQQQGPQQSYSNGSPQPPVLYNSQPLPPALQFSTSNMGAPHISDIFKYENDLNDRINFFDYLPFIIKKRRLESHAPLSLFSEMRKDIYIKILWMHIWKLLEKAKVPYCFSDQTTKEQLSQPSSQIDPLSSENIGVGKCALTFKELKKEKMAHKVESLNNSSKSVDEIVLEVLPSKKIIMILLFRFFKFVYPFMPFLDENSFFFEISGITGNVDFKNTKLESLNFHNKYDYATMGILLIALKLAHLSISDKEFEEKEDLKELKAFSFKSNLITAVNLCLDQYKHWRKPFSLRIMQLLLYRKLYYRYCTEDDDVSDGSGNQILLGTLFSTAYAIGLNRDPDELAKLANSSKQTTHAQLWRRIWHKLLELDANQGITLGLPLHAIDDRSYDTSLPKEESHDDDVDAFINKDYKFVEEKNQLFRDVHNAVCNIRNSPSILDIIHLTKKLENFAHFKIGSLKEILSDKSLPKFALIKKVCYLFEVTSVNLNLYTVLFRHFEEKKNIKRTYQYLEESLSVSLKIINTAMNMAFNEDLYVGKGFAYYFRSEALTAIFRAFFFLSALSLRIIQARAFVKATSPIRAELFSKFHNVILLNMENTLQLMTKMSAKHYNFSRMVTANRLIYWEMKDPNFDFDKSAYALLTDYTGSDSLVHNHLQDITKDDIPKSNILLDLLDSEILRLVEYSNSSLVSVLQPAIRKENGQQRGSQTTQQNSPYNPSGTGRGQFYDPIDGFTKRSSVSTDSFTLSPSAINQNNIFNLSTDGLNKVINPIVIDESKHLNNVNYDTNILSSEEYASLFGVFDDYGTGVDPNSLNNI